MATFDIMITEKQKDFFNSMRGYYFDIVCYLDINTIKEIISCIGCEHFAVSPLHDLDVFDDGEKKGQLKKPHYHIVLVFGGCKRALRLVRLFNTTEIRLIDNEKLLKGSFDYLTHDTKLCEELGKVKYEKSKRFISDINYFENLVDINCKDNSLKIINDLLHGVRLRDMVSKYGKDFVYHFSCYRLLADNIRQQDVDENYHNKLKFLLPVDSETGEIKQIKFDEF